MSWTTPPPPLDITKILPELTPLARWAVRLHPRAGDPGRGDSSLGGPLLWPADAPWPTCSGRRVVERREPMAPADLQRLRDIDAAMHDPVALVGVLQLYARDVPELPFPAQTDLFQLLWCPNFHDAPWYGPHPVTVWRRTAEVTEPLAAPPAPRFDEEWFATHYVPLPCVLHPERVIEYPHAEQPGFSDLPEALHAQVRRWDEQLQEQYWQELSTAPGTKVGGHPRWIQSPQWPVCGCGRRMHHLLTIASDEFKIDEFENWGRWLPREDRDDSKTIGQRNAAERDFWAPHGIVLGDVGSLYLFTCTACAERPLAGTMQC